MNSVNINRRIIISAILLVFGSAFIGIAESEKVGPNPNDEQCTAEYSIPFDNQRLSSPEECDRPCRRDEPPKTCYYRFKLEYYSVLGMACQLCTPNDTNIISNTCQCVLADGVERTLMTVNRKLPGPSIQVCIGDKVIVDVDNDLDGTEVTIHWHGILQEGSQYYDGVPFVTQCPIAHRNSFRYQWFAHNEGTHFWHAHTGMAKMDGIHGSLIVRVPQEDDPNGELYDYDLPTHVMMMVDWMHELTAEHFPGLLRLNAYQEPDSLLINGRGIAVDPRTNITTTIPVHVFTIRYGRRYRFRIINSFCSTCVAELAIEGHPLTLIATDGVPVRPVKVNTVNSVAGERFDVVINANQPPGCYHVALRATGQCARLKLIQLARLCYEERSDRRDSPPPTFNAPLPVGVLLSPLDGLCNETRRDSVCISQLKSARPVDKGLVTNRADYTLYFELGFFVYTLEEAFRPNTYPRFSTPAATVAVRSVVNNISFVAPPSPPLSQYEDLPPGQFCHKDNPPPNCGIPCACTQMYNVTKGRIVEFILTDGIGVGALTHPVHVHGYTFNVLGMGRSPDKKVKRLKANQARDLDRKNLLHRNYDAPPFKDTVAIPNGGYVIIRFRADNPGYWLIHCHFLFHQLIGMELLLHVGRPEDLPPVPRGFPECKNFQPPFEYADC